MRPTLFVTLGFPGSGKTYFTKKFVREFKLFHLNSDAVRADIFKKPQYSPAEHRAVFKKMDFLAGKYLSEGKSVIYDANVNKRKFRSKLQKIAKKQGARYLLLRFKVPVDVAIARLKKRDNIKSAAGKKYQVPVNRQVFLNIKNAIEEPAKSEPNVIIDGTKPYKDQLGSLSGFL